MHATNKKQPSKGKLGKLAETPKDKSGSSRTIELGNERKNSMLAGVKDVRKTLHSNQVLLILICKEAFITNECDTSLSSIVTNLLQEY